MTWGDIPRKREYVALWAIIFAAMVLFNHTLAGSIVGDVLTVPTASAVFWSIWRFFNA